MEGMGEKDGELIDIEKIKDEELTELEAEDETTPIRNRAKDAGGEGETAHEEVASKLGIRVADLKDRFSAFLIDCVVIFYIYWVVAFLYTKFVLGSINYKIPITGKHGMLLHAAFLIIVFIYYFMSESVVGATIGKFICWMFVKRKNGKDVGIIRAFIRNVLRPIDYLLFPIALMLMEKTSMRQRLGDIIAGTTVEKKYSLKTPYKYSEEETASGTIRTIASIIDSIFFISFIIGYVLILNPEEALISQFVLLCMPIAIIIYLVVIPLVSETTPGKWVFGYKICHEDGRRLTLAGILIRSFWLILDANPLGWMLMFLSPRHVRGGDVAAGTVVIKAPRNLKGAASIFIAIALTASTITVGIMNRHNFLFSNNFRLNFLPGTELTDMLGINLHQDLELINVRFAVGSPDKLTPQASYSPGEVLYLIFDVKGFAKKGKLAWIEEDIKVISPEGIEKINQENLLSKPQVLEDRFKKILAVENPIPLPTDLTPGVYTIQVTIRDKYSGKSTSGIYRFFVRRTSFNMEGTGSAGSAGEGESSGGETKTEDKKTN